MVESRIRSLAVAGALGTAIGALGFAALAVFRADFADGATLSLGTGRGGPGVLFVVVPAAVGWLVLGRMARSYRWAIALSATSGAVAYAVARAAATTLAEVPAVTASLFSTMAIAIVIGSLSSAAVQSLLASADLASPSRRDRDPKQR